MEKPQINRKVLTFLVAGIMVFGLIPMQAFASMRDNSYGSNYSDYQAILDKLNEEYKQNFRFVCQDDIDRLPADLREAHPEVKVPTLADFGTLREFEETYRPVIAASAEFQREQQRMRDLYGCELDVQQPERANNEEILMSFTAGNNQQSRGKSSYGFSYGEYAYAYGTKQGSVWYSFDYAVYVMNYDNFQSGFGFYAAGTYTRGSLGLSTLYVKWSGYFHYTFAVQWEAREAWFPASSL